MAEVNQRPTDQGQSVQPDIMIGAVDGDPERNARVEDEVRKRQSADVRDTGEASTEWAQAGDDEYLRGPETIDDPGAPT